MQKEIAKRVPSRRKRKKVVRKLQSRLERIAELANGTATLVGLAATAAELLSALRSETGDETGDEEEDDWPDRRPEGRREGRATQNGSRRGSPRARHSEYREEEAYRNAG